MKYKYIKETINLLIKANNKKRKLNEKISNSSLSDFSQKKFQGMNVDLNYLCAEITHLEHELHCRMVECGLSEREEYRYGIKEENVTAWHCYKFKYREPDLKIFNLWKEINND